MQIDVRNTVRFDNSPPLSIGIGFRIVDDEIETDDWCFEQCGGAFEMRAQTRMFVSKEFARVPAEQSSRPVRQRYRQSSGQNCVGCVTASCEKCAMLTGKDNTLYALRLPRVFPCDKHGNGGMAVPRHTWRIRLKETLQFAPHDCAAAHTAFQILFNDDVPTELLGDSERDGKVFAGADIDSDMPAAAT